MFFKFKIYVVLKISFITHKEEYFFVTLLLRFSISTYKKPSVY